MEDDEKITRHSVGIDCLSLLEGDSPISNSEEIYLGDRMFMDIIKALPTDREKFVALALYNGFQRVDVSYMLTLSSSVVSRETQKMQVILKGYYKRRYPKN